MSTLASLSFSLEIVIFSNPLLGQYISLLLHTAFPKHKILRNGYMQIPKNVQCRYLICYYQFLIYNREWLHPACIEVLPPGYLICHNLLHQVVNRLKVKDELPL